MSSKLDEIFDKYLPNRTATKEQIKSLFLDTLKSLEEKDEGEPGSFNVGYNWALEDAIKKIKEL